MTWRIVWLGAKDRPDLEDTFEDADHDLFIELWALRQIRWSSEVIDAKDIRTALGRRRDNLGCLNLDKVQRTQRPAEPGYGRCAHPKQCAVARMPQRYGCMVEDRRQLRLQFWPEEVERRCFGRRSNHLKRRLMHFDAAGCLGISYGSSFDREHRFVLQPCQLFQYRR